MKPTPDLLEVLGLSDQMKKEFLEVYDEPVYFGGTDFTDAYCSRCGAVIAWSMWPTHVLYHKNLNLAMWMINAYIVEHQKAHKAIGDAFPDLVAILLAEEDK